MDHVSLGDVCNVIAGQHIEAKLYHTDASRGGVPYLTGPADFGETQPVVARWTLSPKVHAKRSDVLITVKGNGVGKCNLGADAAIGRQLMALRPNPDLLDQLYLFHSLRSREEILAGLGQGATVPGIAKDQIASIVVPLPSIHEQKRIAAILDKADAIRRKREQAIKLADEFLRALFLDMFGDPIRNPKGWPLEHLSDSFSNVRSGTRCGPFGSSLKKEEYEPSGIPVWGIDNVLPNSFKPDAKLFISVRKFEQLRAFDVLPGDILISRAGTVGRMCVVDSDPGRSIIGTNLIRLSLNHQVLMPIYLTTLFTIFAARLAHLRANAKEDSYSFMNTGVLSSLRIPFPPLDLQRQFASTVNLLKNLQRRFASAGEMNERSASALSQRAFRGEL